MASGKTTTANYLLNEIPNSKKLTLAQPVYDLVNNIGKKSVKELLAEYIFPYYDPRDDIEKAMGMNIPEEYYLAWGKIIEETLLIPEEMPKPRKRLQFLGTDGARKRLDDNIWIKIAINKATQDPETNWIIDDCRFHNEYLWFTRARWQPVYLFITKDIQKRRLETLYGQVDPDILTHQSETDMNKICVPTECIINSNQLLSDMFKDVKEFIWTKSNFS